MRMQNDVILVHLTKRHVYYTTLLIILAINCAIGSLPSRLKAVSASDILNQKLKTSELLKEKIIFSCDVEKIKRSMKYLVLNRDLIFKGRL